MLSTTVCFVPMNLELRCILPARCTAVPRPRAWPSMETLHPFCELYLAYIDKTFNNVNIQAHMTSWALVATVRQIVKQACCWAAGLSSQARCFAETWCSSAGMATAMDAALNQWKRGEESCRAVLVHASSDRAFCSGAPCPQAGLTSCHDSQNTTLRVGILPCSSRFNRIHHLFSRIHFKTPEPALLRRGSFRTSLTAASLPVLIF
jgi:hypothetical protein